MKPEQRATGECLPFTSTPLQEIASRENFAIYMIRGWMRFVGMKWIGKVMTKRGKQELLAAMDSAIADIKWKQEERIWGRGRK